MSSVQEGLGFVDQQLAKSVMGQGFLGPDVAEVNLEVEYPAEPREQLRIVPYSEGALRECQCSHLLVAGHPLSLLDLLSLCPNLVPPKRPAWYENEPWARTTIEPRWYLIRRDAVPDSFNKTYPEQRALLESHEEVPSLAVLLYAALLHHLSTGEKLFGQGYVRCNDHVEPHCRAILGDFSSYLIPEYELEVLRDPAIGLASMRIS